MFANENVQSNFAAAGSLNIANWNRTPYLQAWQDRSLVLDPRPLALHQHLEERLVRKVAAVVVVVVVATVAVGVVLIGADWQELESFLTLRLLWQS